MVKVVAENGFCLTWTKAGSYSYPLIHRESDGERIWYGHARPFGGKKTEAYTIFKVIASECVSLDGLTSVKDASAEQLITLQKLNNIFIPGGGGEWDLMEIN